MVKLSAEILPVNAQLLSVTRPMQKHLKENAAWSVQVQVSQ